MWSITVHAPSRTGFSGGRCRRVTGEPSKEEEQSPTAHSSHHGPGRLPDCLLSGWAWGDGRFRRSVPTLPLLVIPLCH